METKKRDVHSENLDELKKENGELRRALRDMLDEFEGTEGSCDIDSNTPKVLKRARKTLSTNTKNSD